MSENSQILKQRKIFLFSSLNKKKLKKINNIFRFEKDKNKLDESKNHKNIPIRIQIKLINMFMIYTIFSGLIVECNKRKLQEGQSFIILKTKGSGYKNIFNQYFSPKPFKIYINGNETKILSFHYDLGDCEDNINIFKLIWNTSIQSTYNMFYSCTNIIEIDLSNFDISQVTNMDSMFKECSLLSSLNLSNLDTSQVTNMNSMFYECSSLNELILSNFNTSKITNMDSMFYKCSSLSSLNLSNFDTSQVTSMYKMFYECSSLISLDLSYFDTSQITIMESIFFGCSSLISLDLSYFDTSQVTNMGSMLSGCSSLSSLDLSNFNTSQVTDMGSMFYNDKSLSSLNLSNFDTSNVTNMVYMFYQCESLNVLNLSNFNTSKVTVMNSMFCYCKSLSSLIISNFDTSQVINMNHMFRGCSQLISLNLSNFDISKVSTMNCMFLNCNLLSSLILFNFDISQITNMEHMFSGCSQLISLNLSNLNLSKAKDIDLMFYNCSKLKYINLNIAELNDKISKINIFQLVSSDLLLCTEKEDWKIFFNKHYKVNCYNKNYEYKCYFNNTIEMNNKYICKMCGNNFYMKYNDNNLNIICNDSKSEGYYLDINESVYKPCYHSCKFCDIGGNFEEHNCIKCKEDYPFNSIISNFYNCYNNTFSNIFYNISYIELIQITIYNLLNQINLKDAENSFNKKIIDKNLSIILTSTLEQENNKDSNNITLNLGQCENILKYNYNISNNDSLYILEFIYEEEGMKIPKVEYEIYYPLNNDSNLTKLDLNYCQGTKVEIAVSVKLDYDIDKHNASSGYYNDLCYKTTSESGTDISLKDRRNEFVDNNMTLCEDNCELVDYDYTKEKATCSCEIKVNITKDYDAKFNKKDFLKSFIKINNIANLSILKCYKDILKKKNLIKNNGFYIIAFIILFYFIALIIFWRKSFIILKKDIKKMNLALKKIELIEDDNKINKKDKKKNNKTDKKNKKKAEDIINEKDNNDKKKDNDNKKNKEKMDKRKGKKRKKYIDSFNNNFENNIINNKVENNQIIELNLNKNSKNKSKIKKGNYSGQITQNVIDDKSINMLAKNVFGIENIKDEYTKKLLEQKDFELNGLDYEEALKLDHRDYLQYYFSLIKNNHPIMFSFAPYNDYNSRIIKMFLFFFGFSSDLTINALFFDDDSMHKIYEDKGKFNFLYQIPQILYSTLISRFIDALIKNLALSQDNIVELKQKKEKKDLGKKYYKKIIRTLKIKFISFFIICFIILVFFWYYIICFCGIYVNTQMHLISDSVISLITAQFIPFGMFLIPGIFRIPSLRVEKPTREFLYKLSSFLENYLG